MFSFKQQYESSHSGADVTKYHNSSVIDKTVKFKKIVKKTTTYERCMNLKKQYMKYTNNIHINRKN